MIPDLRAPFFRKPWVRVYNTSGVEIPPHSVVVKGSNADWSSGEPVYPIIKPHSSSTQFMFDGYLVTGPWAIGSGNGAEGVAATLVEGGFVAYSGSTPTFGTMYGPKHDQFTLEPDYYGFAITGGTTTSGGVNVVSARWVGIHSVVGKIDDTNVSLGGSCTVSVHVGTTYQTDSTMNVTGVYNRGTALTSVNGKYCKVSAPNGTPILDWVAC